MPRRQLHLAGHAERLQAALDAIHVELDVPAEFPAEVRDEAAQAAVSAATSGRDLTDVPFVTIDPPTSMDLDQAVHLSRHGSGYLVRYAIADVAAFVAPGGSVDQEAHRRGVTFYGPDRRAPLHPLELSEGAASLLPDVERPALVWELRLDSAGSLISTNVSRARVRSRAKLSYEGIQHGCSAAKMASLVGSPTSASAANGARRGWRSASPMRDARSTNQPSGRSRTATRHGESPTTRRWRSLGFSISHSTSCRSRQRLRRTTPCASSSLSSTG